MDLEMAFGKFDPNIFNDKINQQNSWWQISKEWVAYCKKLLTTADYQCIEHVSDGNAVFEKKFTTVSVDFANIPKKNPTWQITDAICKLDKSNILQTSPTSFGYYYCDYKHENTLPTKRFNCFIRRACPVRQSWFYFLIKLNLLEEGHISYWCENAEYANTAIQDRFDLFYQGTEIFKKEHLYAQKYIDLPYSNFDMPIEEAIIDSEKSIVIETSFDNSDWLLFTEKTFRALQLPRPFLLFSNAGSIAYLRGLGFNVYDDVIDHSYDQYSNWIERQSKILQQVQNPLQYNKATLKEYAKRAEHNKSILLDLQHSSSRYMEELWIKISKL